MAPWRTADQRQGIGWAPACLDLDGAADLDLFVANSRADQLLANPGDATVVAVSRAIGGMDLPGDRHMTFGSVWVDTRGVGARVTVDFADGERATQEVSAKAGWGGAMERRAWFGLGDRAVAAVTVRWPDGSAQSVPVDPWVDGRVRVERPLR